MPNKLKITAVALGLVLLASCSDNREVMSPSSASSKVNVSAASYDRYDARYDGDYDDDSPGDLSAIAKFRTASGNQGADVESAVIGPNGGSLRLGDFEIIVPAGAVSSYTRFSIKTFPENNKRKHALASFLPHRTFAKPITLRVPLNSTESAGDTGAHVMWWNGASWEAMTTTVTSDGRLETQTWHFSLYGTQYRGFTLVGG